MWREIGAIESRVLVKRCFQSSVLKNGRALAVARLLLFIFGADCHSENQRAVSVFAFIDEVFCKYL